MSSEYKYLAKVWPWDTVEAPTGLRRTRDDESEFLSLIDWEWHPVTDEISEPAPDTLIEITPEAAQVLLSDRQRFVRYWSYQHPNSEGSPAKENRVYRRRASPERVVDEVFGRTNAWTPTRLIREFTVGNPADKPDMIAIDREAAEQLIHEIRGITGATEQLGTVVDDTETTKA